MVSEIGIDVDINFEIVNKTPITVSRKRRFIVEILTMSFKIIEKPKSVI